MLIEARRTAEKIYAADPGLSLPEHAALREGINGLFGENGNKLN